MKKLFKKNKILSTLIIILLLFFFVFPKKKTPVPEGAAIDIALIGGGIMSASLGTMLEAFT